jgi:poly A polymerase
MNTLCMNSSGEIIDLLEGKKDIEKRVIKAVFKDIDKELTEDPLRILRAIRFATVLNFDIDKELEKSIVKNKSYLKNISYDRKRKELDLIFLSENVKRGIDLLTYLGIDIELEIYNLKDIKVSKDLLFTWALIEKSNKYRFSKIEETFMNKVKKYLNKDIFDKITIYEMGLYLTTLMAEHKDIKKEELMKIHSKFKIRSKKDIDYDFQKINYLKDKVKDIIEEIENLILLEELDNSYQEIDNYINKKYGGENER